MLHSPLFGSSLRDYLFGTWQIEREIHDRRADTIAHFVGEARFLAADDGLDYKETGILTLNGQAHDAAQINRWIFTADDTAEIRFADDRTFHHITLDGAKASAEHWCPPDEYRGTYIFESPTRWHLTWNVAGPRKDYSSRSNFARLHRGPHSLLSAN